MPTLPALASGAGTQSYAPLADDSYSPSPTLTRTLPDDRPTVSRLSTASSHSSADSYVANGYLTAERVRSGSEETLTLSPSSGRDGDKGKVGLEGFEQGEDGDVGHYVDKQRERERKGKMRADRPWDPERGRPEEVYGEAGSYPPTNAEEEEERRIQENLARMAARDMARRRASRLSRVISPSPSNTPDPNEGGFSSSTSYRRPMSILGLGGGGGGGGRGGEVGKRSSIMGIMDGFWPKSSGSGRDLERIDDSGELALAQSRSNGDQPHPQPSGRLHIYTNPYDAQGHSRIMQHPNSTSPKRSPFDDPDPDQEDTGDTPRAAPRRDPTSPTGVRTQTHARNMSTASEQGFSYGGPGWRGGAGAAAAGMAGGGVALANGYQPEQKEKWWHALCAWGDDLDGGHGGDEDGQAGRTNPME